MVHGSFVRLLPRDKEVWGETEWKTGEGEVVLTIRRDGYCCLRKGEAGASGRTLRPGFLPRGS